MVTLEGSSSFSNIVKFSAWKNHKCAEEYVSWEKEIEEKFVTETTQWLEAPSVNSKHMWLK